MNTRGQYGGQYGYGSQYGGGQYSKQRGGKQCLGRARVGAFLVHTLELKQRYNNVNPAAVQALLNALTSEGVALTVDTDIVDAAADDLRDKARAHAVTKPGAVATVIINLDGDLHGRGFHNLADARAWLQHITRNRESFTYGAVYKKDADGTLLRQDENFGRVAKQTPTINRWDIALREGAWVQLAWHPYASALEVTITDRELRPVDQLVTARQRYEAILRRITSQLTTGGATTVGAAIVGAATVGAAIGAATVGQAMTELTPENQRRLFTQTNELFWAQTDYKRGQKLDPKNADDRRMIPAYMEIYNKLRKLYEVFQKQATAAAEQPQIFDDVEDENTLGTYGDDGSQPSTPAPVPTPTPTPTPMPRNYPAASPAWPHALPHALRRGILRVAGEEDRSTRGTYGRAKGYSLEEIAQDSGEVQKKQEQAPAWPPGLPDWMRPPEVQKAPLPKEEGQLAPAPSPKEEDQHTPAPKEKAPTPILTTPLKVAIGVGLLLGVVSIIASTR